MKASYWILASALASALMAQPPSVSMSPTSGNGSSQTFTFQYTSYTNLNYFQGQVLINSGVGAAGGCIINWYEMGNVVYLFDGNGQSYGSGTIGSATTLQNPQCSINLAGASVVFVPGSFTDQVILPISFASAFAGTQNVFMSGCDNAGNCSGWIQTGNWTVPGAATQVTVSSTPSGLGVSIDSAACTAPCTVQWVVGTSHSIAVTTSPQAGTTNTRYTYSNWSDGGAMSHTVTAAVGAGYTADFNTQYYFTTSATSGGSISPSSGGWYNSGTVVSVSATPSGGYIFTGFSGSLSGTTTPQNLTISNAFLAAQANFALTPVQYTISSSPAGLSVNIDGTSRTTPYNVMWSPGTPHSLVVATPQGDVGSGVRYVFSSWSDGSTQTTDNITAGSGRTYTASFATQYMIATSVSPSGAGTLLPSPGWYSGPNITFNAGHAPGQTFSNYTGAINSTINPFNTTLTGPMSVTANFVPEASVSANCSASPNPVIVGQSTTFTATASGGQGPGTYSYSWTTGPVSGLGSTISFTPSATGTYTESVTATSDNRSGQASCSVLAVTGAPTSAPTLLAPANGGTILPGTAILTWTRLTGSSPADSYVVSFGTTNPPPAISPPVPDPGSGDTASYSASLSPLTTYYWTVKGVFQSLPGPAAAVASFSTTANVPSQVTLVSPTNGAANQATSLPLSWSQASGASSYDVYLGTSPSSMTVLSNVPDPGGSGGIISASSGILSPSQAYYWQVIAKNSGGAAPASATWSFTTAVSGSHLTKEYIRLGGRVIAVENNQ